MTCFDIHTHHLPLHPERAIVSYAVGSFRPDDCVAYASVGIHPWYLNGQEAESQLAALRRALQDDKVVALGEAGLDRLRGCPLDVQVSVFRHEVALAEEYRLPMVVHCVRAFNELLRLKKELQPLRPWVIHGFRGKESGAVELVRHGCHVSFGARFQVEAVCAVPLDRLFVETDEADESIVGICSRIAQARGISSEELAEAINKNVREVFFRRQELVVR